MRADRLLTLMILLQSRGRMTAKALAEELEVSERTVYRDIDALSSAGVPVYAERGPGGGCHLLDSYRTNLTGLNASEAKALFMLTIPEPLAQLGVGQELKAALLKLSAALPASQRLEEARTRQRIHLDAAGWRQSQPAVPCLPVIQRAVWEDRRLRIVYQMEFNASFEEVVAPYGLVAKANVWYLIAGYHETVRVYRAALISRAQLLDQPFDRPDDFNLPEFWKKWVASTEQNHPQYPVTARISPGLADALPHYFGEPAHAWLAQAGPADEQGWVRVSMLFDTLETARERLLSLGGAVEVLEPLPLRLTIQDFAVQIGRRYENSR